MHVLPHLHVKVIHYHCLLLSFVHLIRQYWKTCIKIYERKLTRHTHTHYTGHLKEEEKKNYFRTTWSMLCQLSNESHIPHSYNLKHSYPINYNYNDDKHIVHHLMISFEFGTNVALSFKGTLLITKIRTIIMPTTMD